MRTQLFSVLVCVAACSVPDKEAPTDDLGSNAGSGDTSPLETMITDAPPEFSNNGTAIFKFSANRDDAKFECSVDGMPAMPCTSPFSKKLGDGTHSFSVRATDGDGMSDDTPAEHLWSIDTVAPTTTLTESPPAADNSTEVTFRFTSNEMNVTFECSLDNGAFMTCKSGDLVTGIGDGAHAFAVRAKDRAGNVDASPSIHAWSVDTSTPDTTLLSGPVGAVASQSATFEFISPDAGSGATFECALDGAAFAACSSPVSYPSLSMGQHTFAVRVRDSVGNYDPTPATRTWVIDATPPETMITAGPTGTVPMASVSISFTANENIVSFTCSLDGAAMQPCTSPFNATNLAQGAHTFAVQATDEAGNTDPSPATVSFTVDTVAPDIMFVGGPNNNDTVGPRILYLFTVSEGTVECSVDGAPFMACGSPFGFNAAAGAHSFSVRSTDGAGNSTTATRTFTVACSAPDPTGSLGLLHLDDSGQVLANATGGATGLLGTTDQPETVDPTFTTGRFAGGLAFNATEADVATWPVMAGTTDAPTVELWASPSALPGTRDILVNEDNRLHVRVTAASGSTVQFGATLVEGNGVIHTVVSAPVAADTWHHVLVSLSAPTLRLWVDGARPEIGDTPVSGISFGTLRLGGSYGGAVDEVYIAGAAVTDDEAARGRFCPISGVVY
jgi:hypothetical protein